MERSKPLLLTKNKIIKVSPERLFVNAVLFRVTGLFFFLILIFAIPENAAAQVDTEFWFAPPEVTQGHGDQPLFLRISSQEKPANITISQPARGTVLNSFTLSPNTTRSVDISSLKEFLETKPASTVLKTGLKIISTGPITAYYEEASTLNCEIFALKGKNALGNHFVIPGQNFYNNSDQFSPLAYSSFDVVATQNNTVVTVTPTHPIEGHIGEKTITIRLNAGETYSFKKPSLLGADNALGTVVVSSKPIAITIKDDSAIKSTCKDLLGDQIVPIGVAGTEYIVTRGFLDRPEFLFITATANNTKLFIAGLNVPVANLNAGEVYTLEITLGSTYLTSSKKIYVTHVTGFGCEVGMAVLPSINCRGSRQISFTRSTSEFFGMNVLVKKDGKFHFTLNGSSNFIRPDQFVAVPGTNDEWYSAQVSFSTSQVPVGTASTIKNDQFSFQAGIINGDAGTTCRYGYFSSFSTLFLGDDMGLCPGDSASIDAGPGKRSYLWSTGDTTQTIKVKQSGDYWVKAVTEQCILYDTIHVDVRKAKEDLGPDVRICAGDTARIDGKSNFSWLWSDGGADQFLNTTELGKYWVSVIDEIGCPASDTIEVSRLIHDFDDNTKASLNYVSVDTTDENNIRLSWFVSELERVESNRIDFYKRIRSTSEWRPLKPLPANRDSLIDQGNLTSENSYEYYFGLANPCGKEEIFTKTHNTILLTGTADSTNQVIRFSWNGYQEWGEGVERYELWRKLDDQPGYRFVSTIGGSENSFSATLAADGFKHQYAIRAIEHSGKNESWSNSVKFEFRNEVFVPNVFTPNNSDAFNQYFFIRNIVLYKDSQLIVVDRWGKIVYQSTGYKNDWDGGNVSSGVYYFSLDLKKNNTVIKGPVSILR
jgi:gliding motility-associated-like protein